jgi:hypothetical protein
MVAKEMNYTVPDDDDIARAMALPIEKSIQRVMQWTQVRTRVFRRFAVREHVSLCMLCSPCLHG